MHSTSARSSFQFNPMRSPTNSSAQMKSPATAGGRPRAQVPHPCAKVREPPLGQLLQGPGWLDADKLQVLCEVYAGHKQPAWDKRGAAVHGAGCWVSCPGMRPLTHGVMWPTKPCGHRLTWSPTHGVTTPCSDPSTGHQAPWAPTHVVTNLRGHALTCPHDDPLTPSPAHGVTHSPGQQLTW